MTDLNEPAVAPESNSAPAAIPTSGSDAEPATIVEKVEKAVRDEVAKIETAVEDKAKALDDWFDKHIRDSVISRSTDSYNRVHAALETIRAELARHTGD